MILEVSNYLIYRVLFVSHS